MRRTRMSTALVAGLLSLTVTSAAQAALVTVDQSTGRLVLVTSGNVANDVTISLAGTTITVRDTGETPTPFSGTSCENANADDVATCTLNGLTPEPSVDVNLAGGDDKIVLDGIRAYSIFGGPGQDTITGSDLGDTLQGADGDDILDGGGGADLLYGGAGNDTLRGGQDGDIYDGGSGADTFSDTGTTGATRSPTAPP